MYTILGSVSICLQDHALTKCNRSVRVFVGNTANPCDSQLNFRHGVKC